MQLPLEYISLGCGVQSSTLLYWADKSLFGLARPVFAVFGDTEHEPQSVYRWFDFLKKSISIPIHCVKGTRGNITLLESSVFHSSKTLGSVYRKSIIPSYGNHGRSMLQRKCTEEYKIIPIVRFVKKEIGSRTLNDWRRRHKSALAAITLARKQKEIVSFDALAECESDPLAVCWIGISTDEADRAKPSRHPWIKHRFPLLDLGVSRSDCLRWFKEHNLPMPPKSACFMCPYHSNAEWLRLKTQEPEEFAKAVAFERGMHRAHKMDTVTRHQPFLHRECVPLDKIDFADLASEGPVHGECTGYCHT